MKLIIHNGRITATATDEYAGPEAFIVAPDGFEIDRLGEYVVTDGLAVIPAPSTPQSCTRRQGRLALLANGYLDDVEAAIASISVPIEQRAAQIEYEADTWERSNPFVQQVWAQLGGSPAQLDDLFRLAVTL